ncbi:MAG: pantetheine-phosphate adenylyltransferase [Chloroflexi bacterium]|uniref:Phosphopantetheine adenylyltransferase n=1 Tax=Candidatus Chlorohelix allophototropha TaxID=3003348 RepID=A0A8T7LWZ8_9CHLR|nr:pantetheine-phosphate adenylyltransferase [Chloroflexota bacterium]WJW67366.1 pantetheine-phosphate adenylyltransferase [Chloroflexota bacterium L227-S17]
MVLALYPASFDPITYGHIDIATRAAKIFDEVVIAPYDAPVKNLLFSTEERKAMIIEAIKNVPNIRVEHYKMLTTHYAHEIGAQVIIRGLRTVSDFDYELQLTQNYRNLAPHIEICYLMTSQNFSYIASSMVKEIARLGGDVSQMVPPHIATKLYTAYNTVAIKLT